MKPFQHAGLWWLPSKEEQKVSGEAVFAENDPIKLVLQGTFDHDFQPGVIEFLSYYPLIWGITNDGQPVTLLNCHETHRTFSFSVGEDKDEEQEYEQECQADIAFIGAHFTDPEQISFHKIDVQYRYLPQWADLFPYYGHQKPLSDYVAVTNNGTITVQLIPEVWEASTQKADLIGEEILPEVVRMRIEVPESLSLEQWMDRFITPLQHLISFATQRPTAITSILGYTYQRASDTREIPVRLAFVPNLTSIETNKDTFPETILFSLQTPEPSFSNIINSWLHIADNLNSMCRLFFGVRYTHLPLDVHFLLIAQAVEVYQDHYFHKAPLPEEEYQNLMETLLSACPSEHQRKWLSNALEHSNTANYRQQLKNLVARATPKLQPLFGKNAEERKKFAEVVYNTRNYFTHHTKSLAGKAASGKELFYIMKCLSLSLQVCILEDLGFLSQDIIEIVHRHEDYPHLHFLRDQIDLEKL